MTTDDIGDCINVALAVEVYVAALIGSADMDIDQLFSAARIRIYKMIDKRIAIAHGKPIKTANRSVGALYSKRWINKRGLKP